MVNKIEDTYEWKKELLKVEKDGLKITDYEKYIRYKRNLYISYVAFLIIYFILGILIGIQF